MAAKYSVAALGTTKMLGAGKTSHRGQYGVKITAAMRRAKDPNGHSMDGRQQRNVES